MVKAKIKSCKKGQAEILNNINFMAKAGELTVILGTNGAGKSTLLKILTGIDTAFEGEIHYNNIPLSAFNTQQLAQTRAVLSQQIHVSFPCKAKDVVQMGLYAHRKEQNSLSESKILDHVSRQADIEKLLERDYHTLSGGEKQRIHWARVLAQLTTHIESATAKEIKANPKALFLDEPVTSMDIKHQIELLETARNTAKNNHWAVVAVLHDLNLASQYADIIYLMKQGNIIAKGNPETVLTSENIRNVYDVGSEIISINEQIHIILNTKPIHQYV